MKITLALDLKHRSDGALEYVRWLAQNYEDDPEIHGIHIVSAPTVAHDTAPITASLTALEQTAQRQLEQQLRACDAEYMTARTIVRCGGDIDRRLESEFLTSGSQLLLIGRAAERHEYGSNRLGPIAQRLVRRLQQPLTIVPPDLRLEDIGEGPVLVALSCRNDDVAAARWALEFAINLDREVVFVHVRRPAELYSCRYVGAGNFICGDDHVLSQGRVAALAWMDQHAWQGHSLIVDKGPTAPTLLGLARELDACTLVCGARRQSAGEHSDSPSVGGEVAGYSTLPVCLIPQLREQHRQHAYKIEAANDT